GAGDAFAVREIRMRERAIDLQREHETARPAALIPRQRIGHADRELADLLEFAQPDAESRAAVDRRRRAPQPERFAAAHDVDIKGRSQRFRLRRERERAGRIDRLAIHAYELISRFEALRLMSLWRERAHREDVFEFEGQA